MSDQKSQNNKKRQSNRGTNSNRGSHPKNKNFKKRRNFSKNSKNRRPKSLTPAKVLQKYDNLMEQYLNARRKYFELHGRNSTRNLGKAERNYEQALKNLREFSDKLQDWQKEVLEQKVDGYKPDREYSTNHDLKPEGEQVSFVGEFEDPHLLPTQADHQWSEDTEESEGTMEDYEKYKASSF
ncbi:MAG: hypothetical protein CME62_15335 [Halobacteriovoraceae bacterium]|nr:hypothetical protein [Halobacteriovoraceae bacterium]|tara:strand:+ start:15893 stop:16438 length:546 start_codon:yes stop_codon:yes gene_type:complete